MTTNTVKIGFSTALVGAIVLQAGLVGVILVSCVGLNSLLARYECEGCHSATCKCSPAPLPKIKPKGGFEDSHSGPSGYLAPVNEAARVELKQSGWVFSGEDSKEGNPYCPTCPQQVRSPYRIVQPAPSRVVQPYVPTYVTPNYVRPAVQPAAQPYVQPRPAPQPAPAVVRIAPGDKPSNPSNRIQLSLFLIPGDALSEKLKNWFTTNATLVKWRSEFSYQEFTPTTPLYQTLRTSDGRMMSEKIPVSKFPAVVVATADGGHIHAAGQSTIPDTVEAFIQDVQTAWELKKSVQNTDSGAIQSGPSWDLNITPSMRLEDCNGPNCPDNPDKWVLGQRVNDLLSRPAKNGFAKDALWGWLDILVWGVVAVICLAAGLFTVIFVGFLLLVLVWIVSRKK